MDPKKGLRFSVINTKLPGALQAWFKADGKEKEDKELKELLNTKGVVMRMSSEETDLAEAVRMWNERNKNLSEYFDNLHGALFNDGG